MENNEIKPDVTPESVDTAQDVPQTEAKDVPSVKELIRERITIDGEEHEVDLDELKKGYQLAKASHKRLQEAASLRKQAEQVIHLLKTNPREALRHPAISVDQRALAEEILAESLEEEMLSPTEKEVRSLKKQLADREAAERAAKEQSESARAADLEKQYTATYQKQMSEALTGAGLPVTNSTVKAMASYLQTALENNMDLSPADVVDLVKDEYRRQMTELFSASDAQTMIALIGEEGLSKLRQYDTSRIKTAVPPVVPADKQGKASEGKKERRASTWADKVAELEKKFGPLD